MARSPKIREAEAADVPAIAAVVKSTGILPNEVVKPLFDRYVEEKAANLETRPICLVAVDDRDVPLAVAYFVYEAPTNMTWNLLLLAVDKAHHGRGLGKQILTAVEYVLKTEAAARMLIIETSSTGEFDRTRAVLRQARLHGGGAHRRLLRRRQRQGRVPEAPPGYVATRRLVCALVSRVVSNPTSIVWVLTVGDASP
ncbi:hypothetical protein PINS_up023778 [Pythium insidiosum]|nr:hypothetical protein PINS_up023778 [Pythium insidiosum]